LKGRWDAVIMMPPSYSYPAIITMMISISIMMMMMMIIMIIVITIIILIIIIMTCERRWLLVIQCSVCESAAQHVGLICSKASSVATKRTLKMCLPCCSSIQARRSHPEAIQHSCFWSEHPRSALKHGLKTILRMDNQRAKH